MKKAIFLDIDGTLLDFHNGLTKITSEVEQAIRGLQAAGHYVFLATGRPFAFLNPDLLNFGFDGYVLSNGAQVMMNDQNIYTAGFDQDFTKKLTSSLDEKNIEYMLQSYHYTYMKDNCQTYYGLLADMGVAMDFMKSDFVIEDVVTQKMQMLCPTEEEMAWCIDFANQHPEYGYFYSMGATQFELYAKDYSKARGITETLKHLNIPIEQSYAFGDGDNDIEMLAAVGCGIAMDNASDHVKSFAHVVTKSVLEDGVAHGIKTYVLANS